MSGECCFGFVLFNHLDLIITQEPIHKEEEHVGHGVINQGINMWQGKIILRASQTQISIINTHAYFPIFLWHGNNVGDPIKVGYGGIKTNFQMLFYFFVFRIISDFILRRACPTKGHTDLTRILWTTISVSSPSIS